MTTPTNSHQAWTDKGGHVIFIQSSLILFPQASLTPLDSR